MPYRLEACRLIKWRMKFLKNVSSNRRPLRFPDIFDLGRKRVTEVTVNVVNL